MSPEQICPKCGGDCWRDSADVGVGIIYGPWGCPCGWSELPEFDLSTAPHPRTDQYGGFHPKGCHCGEYYCPDVKAREEL
jgi:hypothetical protein